MPAAQTDPFVQSMLALFTEAYQGSPYSYTWFIEGKECLFETLKPLSAEQASQAVGRDGSTIAAHTEHLRWSLALANAFARGEHPNVDWEESWTVHEVSQQIWDQLRTDLRAEFETLREAMQANSDWSDDQMRLGAFALVPHAAFHLGAILQMTAHIKLPHP